MKNFFFLLTMFTLIVVSLPIRVSAENASMAATLDSSSTASQSASKSTPYSISSITPSVISNSLNPDPTTLTIQNNISQSSANVSSPEKVEPLGKRNFRANEEITIVVDNGNVNSVNISVYDVSGNKVPVQLEKISDQNPAILRIVPPKEFKAGRYRVAVTDSQGNVTNQDFTWGVLAINSDKSVYLPNETADFSMAVLDETGNVACDAAVTLQITNPSLGISDILSTANGKITVNRDCFVKDYTSKPDYEALYQVKGPGTYNLNLTAVTKNGTYSISDNLVVNSSVSFDVQRVNATRIFPPVIYSSVFNITANQDFTGTISETVPANFAVIPLSGTQPFEDSTPSGVLQNNLPALIPKLSLPFNGMFAVSQPFGVELIDPVEGKKYHDLGLLGHDGVDFDLPEGTPVLSTDDGTVLMADINGPYGTTIIIQHAWGESYYGHLSVMMVKAGDQVKKGDEIALSGDTGMSTGPHLHFGIKPTNNNPGNGYFGKIDPSPYLGIAVPQIIDNNNLSTIGYSDNYAVRVLRWEVSLKKGDKITLGYDYKVPNVSPEFYLLGPLQFTDSSGKVVFTESRQWQLAIDSATTPITQAEQQVNILDQMITAAGSTGSTGKVYIDPSTYNAGSTSLTYYFEVDALVTSGTGTVTLTYQGGTVSVSPTATSYTRYRSSGFTPSAAGEAYISTVSGTGIQVEAARIIIDQVNGSGIQNSETQVELGNAESTSSNSSSNLLQSPKLWKYDSTKYSGSPTFNFEATLAGTGSSNANAYLYDVTASSAVSGSTVTAPNATWNRERTLSAISLISGHTYKVGYYAGTSGNTVSIANAHVIIDQTAGGVLAMLETYAQFINTNQSAVNMGTFSTTNQSQLTVQRKVLAANVATIGGNTYIYAIGGQDNSNNYQSSVYKATINTSGDITGGFATTSQAQLPTTAGMLQTTVQTFGGTTYLYVLGGLNGGTLSSVYKATINTSGNIQTFSTASQGQLPIAVYQHSVATATVGSSTYVYVLGGYTSGDQSTVYKAYFNTSGNIQTFSTASQAQLPVIMQNFATLTANVAGTSYIYVIGGYSTGSSSNVSTVYKATISSTGDITGTFSTASQAQLPQVFREHSAVLTTIQGTNYIYVLGGYDSAQRSTVYRAVINTSGNVGTFSTVSQAQLPVADTTFGLTQGVVGNNDYLYVLGGALSAAASSTVYKAQIDPASYTSFGYFNNYNSANWAGSSISYYFESTFIADTNTGSTELTPGALGAVSTSSTTAYSLVRSGAISLSSGTDYDTELKQANVNSSWLVIDINGVIGPTLDLLMKHGMWFSNGVKQSFTFMGW
jgi:murein DD-endopeptidase MepM/ murein hydrolase activator NlpD